VNQRGLGGAVLVLLVALAGCGDGLRGVIGDSAPRDRYETALERSGLGGSVLVRDWQTAARRAIDSAPVYEPPFLESGYLDPARPEARGYRISLRRGQRLNVEFSLRGVDAAPLFAELLELPQDTTFPDRLASADSGEAVLSHEARRDGAVILLIQPELMSGGRYEVRARIGPSLAFPVGGADARAIRSRFGADREGGRRQHEGVDIFASRGTPVLAAAGGLARWVGENRLGGNVIMVRDRQRNEGHYYAHLDSQLISEGTIVEVGDTIGLVGNTGNARTTPPHLHFGIYARGEGAVDPWPYLAPGDTAVPAIAADTSRLGEWWRVGGAGARLAGRPGGEDGRELPAGTVLRGVAGTGVWLRAELIDGTWGFVPASRVVPAAGLGVAPPGTVALERPDSTAVVVDTIAEGDRAVVMGRFGGFDLLQLEDGSSGWALR